MSRLYGCHNHPPYVDSYVTGRGWDRWGRVAVYHVLNTASKDCRYDLNHSDPRCKDCTHGPKPVETRSPS